MHLEGSHQHIYSVSGLHIFLHLCKLFCLKILNEISRKFHIKFIHGIYQWISRSRPCDHASRSYKLLLIAIFYEAVNYGRTIQILHKNYEIVINELLLHFRIVNSLIGMTNISTLSSTLLYKHILGSVIKDPYQWTYCPRTVRSNLFLSVSIYHHNSQQ